jgi:hypothetical protein
LWDITRDSRGKATIPVLKRCSANAGNVCEEECLSFLQFSNETRFIADTSIHSKVERFVSPGVSASMKGQKSAKIGELLEHSISKNGQLDKNLVYNFSWSLLHTSQLEKLLRDVD